MIKFKPRFFHLQWHITERCNLNCRHCYQDHDFLKKEIKTQELFNVLDGFIKQIKDWKLSKENVKISLTGGEPFMRKDFFELLKKCYNNRSEFRYGILTNGTFLDEETVKQLKKLRVDYVQISLEGTEKINDSIRGRGVFKKAIKAVKLLKKEGVARNLSMTVSKTNLKEVPKMLNLSKKLRVGLGVRRYVPCGKKRSTNGFLLEPAQVRKLWHYLLKKKQSFWPKISLGCEDGMLIQDFPCYQPNNCSAGHLSFTVLPNGDIYPCRRLPVLSGNLLKQSFKSIYYNSEPLKKLRNLHNINDVCYSCPHYEKCNGGAKCMAFGYFKEASSPDPQCWRLFKELPDVSLKWRNSVQKRQKKLKSDWVNLLI